MSDEVKEVLEEEAPAVAEEVIPEEMPEGECPEMPADGDHPPMGGHGHGHGPHGHGHGPMGGPGGHRPPPPPPPMDGERPPMPPMDGERLPMPPEGCECPPDTAPEAPTEAETETC